MCQGLKGWHSTADFFAALPPPSEHGTARISTNANNQGLSLESMKYPDFALNPMFSVLLSTLPGRSYQVLSRSGDNVLW
jgi:hypothetical protein